ncbi:MAG: protoporphyrinogen oxidase [Planctomycetota bacterium]
MNAADPRRRIAIVGGGLSGLATAAHCKQLGADVTVLEASGRVGGVIHSEQVDVPEIGSFVIDHGADMFATNPPAAMQLCELLGVQSLLQTPKHKGRGAMIAKGDRLVPIPEGFVLMRATKITSMLTTPLLSPTAKLRLLAEQFVPRRSDAVTDESVGEFVRRRMGSSMLNSIVAPLVAGIYTADVDKLSMAATMKPIWEMESQHGSLMSATRARQRTGQDSLENASSGARYEQFRAFPGGMAQWMRHLTDFIGAEAIELESPVTSIAVEDQSVRVCVAGQWREFDELVLATPANATIKLFGAMDAPEHASAIRTIVEQLEAIPLASTAIIVLGIDRRAISRLPETFGFVVPPKECRRILAGSFASSKFDGRAPETHVIIRAFVGGVLQSEILKRTDAQLVDLVRADLVDLIGLDTDSPLEQIAPVIKVIRWNDAMPQYEVGHLDRVKTITSALNTIPNIHLAGNSLNGVGIAPLIANAERLAKKLTRAPQTSQPDSNERQ